MYSNDPFYAHFAQDSELELTALKPLVEVGNVEDSIITNMILYDDWNRNTVVIIKKEAE